MKKKEMPGSVFILMTALLWSTAGLCVKLLPWGALSIACVRGLLCGALLIVLRVVRMRKNPNMPKFRFSRHNVLAGFCMFATSTLYVLAIKLTTAANAIVLQYIAPILVLLYTMVIEKRRPKTIDIVLTLVVFGGCVLTFSSQLEAGGMLGNVLALLSGVALAAQLIVNRRPETQAEDGLLIGCGMSFFVFLPFLLTDTSLVLTPQTVGVALFLGLFQYGLANVCFARGIRTTDAVSAALLFTIEPILTPIWVFVTIGERPTATALLGFACVVVAVTLHSVYPYLSARIRARRHVEGKV